MRLGVDLGARGARDDLVVPRTSGGPSLGFVGGYRATLGDGLVDVGMRLRFAALFDRDGHPAASLAHGLHVGYLWLARRSPSGWSVAIGPLLAWQTDVLWLAQWDDAHAYWLGRTFLGVSMRSWRPLNRDWRLDVGGELNLVGLESRPPSYRHNNQDALTSADFYVTSVHRAGRIGSVFNWQALRLHASLSATHATHATPEGHSFGIEGRLLHTRRPDMALVLELSVNYVYAWGL